MEVLKSCKRISFFANLFNKNGIQVFGYRIPNWFIDSILLLPMTVCSIQMIVYCCLFGTSLKSISSAVYLCLGISSIALMHICWAIENDLSISTVDHLQRTVEQRIESNDGSQIIYAKQEQRNGNLVKHLLYYSTFVIVSIYLPPFLFPIAYAIFGFPGPKHWYLPYPTVVPFDINSPIGFYAVLTLQWFSGMSYMLLITVISCLYIGLCTYINACVEDLSTFDSNTVETMAEKKQLLRDMIRHHIAILKLLDNVRILMNGPLFFQLLVYAVFISLNLLQFDETFKEFNFNILLNLNSLATQILFNYISCYHANNLTLKSWSTSDIAYNTLWYTFPVDSQRSIMQMIQRSQKPFYLKGFGIVDCSLATFLNFFRTAVSYYIIFRQFGN